MGQVILLQLPQRRWACPSCNLTMVTRDPVPPGGVVTKLHNCPGQAGLLVPYVEVVGRDLRKHSHVHRVIERGDVAGDEVGLRTDANGRVVMAVHTEREDGYDTIVFPGCARIDVGELP